MLKLEAHRLRARMPAGLRTWSLWMSAASRATTQDLARLLEDWRRDGRDVAFLIGGRRRPRTRAQAIGPPSAFAVRHDPAAPAGAGVARRAALPCRFAAAEPSLPSRLMRAPAARHIYLASRSSRRRELLKQIGVSFEMLLLREGQGRPADFDETPLPGEVAGRLRAARRAGQGGGRLGTPRRSGACCASRCCRPTPRSRSTGRSSASRPTGSRRSASCKRLSGKAHQVHTAVAVKFDQQIEVALSSTEVEFRELDRRARSASTSPAASRWTRPAPTPSRAAAAVFVRSISGSYTGVVGLPLFETSQLLARFGHRTV